MYSCSMIHQSLEIHSSKLFLKRGVVYSVLKIKEDTQSIRHRIFADHIQKTQISRHLGKFQRGSRYTSVCNILPCWQALVCSPLGKLITLLSSNMPHMYALGPLHWLFPLPRMFFPQKTTSPLS